MKRLERRERREYVELRFSWLSELTKEFIKGQREVIRMSNERSTKVCPVVATEQVGATQFQHRLERSDFVAGLSVEYTEFRYHPLSEVRLPQAVFLPAVVDRETPVPGNLAVCKPNGKLVFLRVEARPDLTFLFAVVVHCCVIVFYGEAIPDSQAVCA